MRQCPDEVGICIIYQVRSINRLLYDLMLWQRTAFTEYFTVYRIRKFVGFPSLVFYSISFADSVKWTNLSIGFFYHKLNSFRVINIIRIFLIFMFVLPHV